jgi:hypothetical protein
MQRAALAWKSIKRQQREKRLIECNPTRRSINPRRWHSENSFLET